MPLRLATLLAGAVLGVAAWSVAGRGLPSELAAANLVVGWAFFAAAAAIGPGDGHRRISLLLIGTGLAWFAGDLVPGAVFLHRGTFIHLLLAYPTGGVTGRAPRAAVTAAYALAVATSLGLPAVAWIAVAAALVLLGLHSLVRRQTHPRRARQIPAIAAIALGAVLLAGTGGRLLGAPIDRTALLAYEAVLGGTAVLVAAGVLWHRRSGLVTGLVVDLGNSDGAGMLRDRLASAVGDPGLVIALCANDSCTEFVDERGLPVRLPPPGADTTITPMLVQGRQTGALIHDPVVLRDARSVQLVAALAQLVTTNAALQRDIERSLEETSASRTRLVHAADAQRRRIEAAIRAGPARRLDQAAGRLSQLARPGESTELATLTGELQGARDELLAFARGVHPALLRERGLTDAIADLGRRAGCRADVAPAIGRHDPAIEATLYFVAAEAIANAVKHARAGTVAASLRSDAGHLVLRVVDDGVGGAAVADRGGLRGLADRLDALGGRLDVRSAPGSGTTVEARVPSAGERSAAPGLASVPA